MRSNRRFHLIGDDGRLVNGKFAGPLVTVAASSDPNGTSLTLRFPDGSLLERAVELGEPVETNFYGRPVAGSPRPWLVRGRPVRRRRPPAPARARRRAGSRL